MLDLKSIALGMQENNELCIRDAGTDRFCFRPHCGFVNGNRLGMV